MNCERATEIYLAILTGENDPAQERAMREHLTGCAACRDATEALATLWADLDSEASPAPETLRPRVEALVEGYRQGWRDAAGRLPWRARAAGWLGGFRPVPAWRPAMAVVMLLVGVALGTLVDRSAQRSEITALRQEMQSTRGLVALSLLQQRSPSDRLQGVMWSASAGAHNPEVVTALISTLDNDPNVNVRLAAADALAASLDVLEVRDAMLASLERQTSPLVQIALIDALAQAGEPRARSRFQELVEDPRTDATVRSRARWALRQLES